MKPENSSKSTILVLTQMVTTIVVNAVLGKVSEEYETQHMVR